MLASRTITKDKRYAWVVCFCCSLSIAIGEGVGTAFGVLIPHIQRELKSDTSLTSLIGSVHMSISLLPGPIFMALTKRFGVLKIGMVGVTLFAIGILVCASIPTPAVLIIFYGAISGIGMGMKHAVEKLAINMYFDKKRALANSIFYCGAPIGYLVAAPLLTQILQMYGLKATFYFQFGTAVFNGVILYFTFSQIPDNEYQPVDEKKQMIVPWCPIQVKVKKLMESIIHPSVVTNAGLMCYLIGRVFFSTVTLVPAFYLPAVLQQNGNNYTPTEAAFAVTIIGVFSLIGRGLTGLVDLFSDYSVIILAVLNIGCAVAVLMMTTLQSSLICIYVACALFGLFSGPKAPLGPCCLAYLVGIDDEMFSCAMGLNMCAYGCGIILGVPVIGYVADYFHGFHEAFIMTATIYCISATANCCSEFFRINWNSGHANKTNT